MKRLFPFAAGVLSVPVILLFAACIIEEDPGEQETAEPTQPVEGATPTPVVVPATGHTCPAQEVESPNHWVAYEAPSDLEGTGWKIGDVLPNFTLVDQYGEEVSLYQFYGMVIMIEVGAVWCTYCNESAAKSPSLLDSYSDDCVIFLYLLTQDASGGEISQSDVEYWAEEYDLDYPVLGDVGEAISDALGVKAYPMFYFVDREMVLRSKTMGSDNYREINRNIQVLL